MSKLWERLEEIGRILSVPIQRHLVNDVDSNRLATLIHKAHALLLNSYRKFGHDSVYLSFNGGKDSVAVLHLYRLATLTDAKELRKGHPIPLNVVYFKDRSMREFTEVTGFMERTASTYNFPLKVIEGSWRNGIPKLSPGDKNAFIIGVRNTDFDTHELCESQEGAVDNVTFTRIHPIVRWNYGDVWNFIRLFSLDYCSLYDNGYTSLGRLTMTQYRRHYRKSTPEKVGRFLCPGLHTERLVLRTLWKKVVNSNDYYLWVPSPTDVCFRTLAEQGQ